MCPDGDNQKWLKCVGFSGGAKSPPHHADVDGDYRCELCSAIPRVCFVEGVQTPTGVPRSVSLSAVGVGYLGMFINLLDTSLHIYWDFFKILAVLLTVAVIKVTSFFLFCFFQSLPYSSQLIKRNPNVVGSRVETTKIFKDSTLHNMKDFSRIL